MKKCMDDVTAFHRLVGATIGDVAKPDATVDLELRVKLIAEEFDELLCALSPDSPAPQISETVKEWLFERRHWIETRADVTPDLPAVADALADLAYVTVGANVTWGIPGAAVWSEVNSANMRKAGGPKDPITGKALKPPGWTPPDIEGVLKREAHALAINHNCARCDKDVTNGDAWSHHDYCYEEPR